MSFLQSHNLISSLEDMVFTRFHSLTATLSLQSGKLRMRKADLLSRASFLSLLSPLNDKQTLEIPRYLLLPEKYSLSNMAFVKGQTAIFAVIKSSPFHA